MSKGKSNPRTKSPFAEKSESDTEFEKLSILEKKLLCHRGYQKKEIRAKQSIPKANCHRGIETDLKSLKPDNHKRLPKKKDWSVTIK